MTFKDAKVGNKVWGITRGWGTIIRNNEFYERPILVEFSDGSELEYLYTGCQHEDDINPTLFWNEIKFTLPEPIKYRTIHGVEIPDISFVPREGETFCFPCIDKVELFLIDTVNIEGTEEMEHRIDNKLCYPDTEEGKRVAILHAKVLLNEME